MASISSKKIRQAFLVLAISNSSRTILAPYTQRQESKFNTYNDQDSWSHSWYSLPGVFLQLFSHSPLPHTSAPARSRWLGWSRRQSCWPRRGHTGSFLCRAARIAAHLLEAQYPDWQTSQAGERRRKTKRDHQSGSFTWQTTVLLTVLNWKLKTHFFLQNTCMMAGLSIRLWDCLYLWTLTWSRGVSTTSLSFSICSLHPPTSL